MPAVTERERRATAGRRMSDLVGKAAEDDEAFWSHDVWAEDDSGNDSFHESDEDSEQRKDQFDSDFDDSETDNEAEEMAAGEAEEAELEKAERSSRKRKGYVDIAKAGRDLMQKKKGTSRKRKKDLMGDGINAGLVLNLPGAVGAAPTVSQPPASAVSQEAANKTKTKPASPTKPAPTLASTRSLRSTQASARRQLRAGTRHKTMQQKTATDTKSRQTGTQQAKKQQRRFTQEELLLEAATVTEPENERWLLGRKRIQDLENFNSAKDASMNREVRGKVLFKFHSRRGCFNTLTFPEMDAVPAILARTHDKPKRPRKDVCVITGKRARYRDPKTRLGYHDLAAFKELRRRLEAGEPLDQSRKDMKQDGEKAPTEKKSNEDKAGISTTVVDAPSEIAGKAKEATKAVPAVNAAIKETAPAAVKSSQPAIAAASSSTVKATTNPTLEVPSNDTGPVIMSSDGPKALKTATSATNSQGTMPKVKPKVSAGTPVEATAKQPAKTPSSTAGPVPKTGNVPNASKSEVGAAKPKAVAVKTESKPSEPPSIRTDVQQPAEKQKPLKSASPTTASMIHNALAAYAKLHDNEEG